MKYIALLRGINVGGNNKVAMADLRKCLELAGFSAVSTYINSGNVLFESDETDITKLVEVCEGAIEETFGFHVICSVISAHELKNAMDNAPPWWNKGDARHNALFVIAPRRAEELMAEIGEPRPEFEKVFAYHPIIFWSAPAETMGRTRYNKIAGTPAYKSITIRNGNTTRKLLELSGKF